MTNGSRISLSSSSVATNKTECNLIPSTNSTVALAPNWENIPETLLFNASIGFLLYMLFYLLTKIAWSNPSSNDNIHHDNLVTFLYGYRDPERWYVIPRFEFLRRSPKHHEHDLSCSKIYVPPKLPVANPIELLAYESMDDVGDETESAEEIREDDLDNVVAKTMKSIRCAKTSIIAKPCVKNIPSEQKTKEKPVTGKVTVVNNDKVTLHQHTPASSALKEVMKSPSIKQSHHQSDKLTKFKSTLASNKSLFNRTNSKSPTPLSGSFFYPSILTAERLQASNLARQLNRFFGLFFRVTDADIIYAKGIDAYEYLLFQRHLILIMLVANIFCLGIILPVHWFFGRTVETGNQMAYVSSFQRTTIKNMSSNSTYFWAHIMSSVLIVALTIMILSSYRDSIVTKNEAHLSRKTLLIGNIPLYQRTRTKLCEIFREYFPGSDIKSIQFVYNTARLEYFQLQLDTISLAKDYCLNYKQKYNQELMVRQTDVNEGQYCNGNCRFCSFLMVFSCYWPCEQKQPGSVFYANQERLYRNKIRKGCEKLIQEPSEYAFVTLRSNKQAKRVMQVLTRLKNEVIKERYASMWEKGGSKRGGGGGGGSAARAMPANKQTSSTSITDETRPASLTKSIGRDFFVSNNNAAKDPLDPNNNPHVRSIRSPIAGMSGGHNESAAIGPIRSLDSRGSSIGGLDGPLAWSVRYAPHPDNVEYYDILEMSKISKYTSALLHAVMIIIFIFFTTPNVLLSAIERWSVLQPEATKQMTGFQGLFINYLSILLQITATAILPSLIVLISKQIPYEDTSSKNHSTMWKTYLFLVLMVIVMPSIGMNSAQALLSSEISPECWFPTDNGAYFVNYVLTSVFLSSVLELVKPIDIIFYYFILWTSRSSAEFEGGRQYIEREFSVSMQHTGVLLVFSVVMTYMISCPLIAPAGLLYLIVKHAIDHYHLFYTYFTKKVDKDLQKTIELFVRVALLLMLFQTTVAIYISTGASNFSLMSQIVFWLTLAVFVFNCCFDCTSGPMATSTSNRVHQHNRDFCACFYLPRVMGDLLRANAVPESCISRKV